MSDRTLRILLATTALMRGGAEIQVYLLARELRARGHAVHVVSLLLPEAFETEFADLGIGLTSLGLERGHLDPRGVAGFAAVVRRWRPDIVHSHMVHANLLSRIARPFAWSPALITTAHNLAESAGWRNRAYRYTDPLATLTTNVCHAGAMRYVELGATPARKMRVVPNGIEIVAFRRSHEERAQMRSALGVGERFTWLAVGRLEPAKDYPTMLRAFAASQPDDAVLLIAGGGAGYDDLVRAREALGLTAAQVRLLGARPDIADLLAASDGYLMSSVTEGLPLVLLEASAASRPIVATDVGGNSEVVIPGCTGFLSPPSDPTALAAAMRRLQALEPGARATMGEAALRLVMAEFDLARIVDRWVTLYQEVIARGRPSG